VYEKVHDEQGRPMHKSHGNAIWFDEAVEKMGADVMRWIYAGSNIQNNLNFGFSKGDDVVRNLLTLWNVYSFFVTYALVDEWKPSRLPGEGQQDAPAKRAGQVDPVPPARLDPGRDRSPWRTSMLRA